ncbi:hypothetical protein V8E52_004959 [Russula decolorans]
MCLNINRLAPGAKEFYLLNEPSTGATLSPETFPSNKKSTTTIQVADNSGVSFPNRDEFKRRVSSDNSHATDWHLVHIGGLIGFRYARRGRYCYGSYSGRTRGRRTMDGLTDRALKRIVDFSHTQGVKVGIQLAHAGRKASTLALPFQWSAYRYGPVDSDVPYPHSQGDERTPSKLRLDEESCLGWLPSRSVWYGERGEKPLFVWLSAAEGPKKDTDGKCLQWGIEQTILLTGELKKLGFDLIGVSSGGNWPAQKIPVFPGYQRRSRRHIRTFSLSCVTNELRVVVEPAVQYELGWQEALARM